MSKHRSIQPLYSGRAATPEQAKQLAAGLGDPAFAARTQCSNHGLRADLGRSKAESERVKMRMASTKDASPGSIMLSSAARLPVGRCSVRFGVVECLGTLLFWLELAAQYSLPVPPKRSAAVRDGRSKGIFPKQLWTGSDQAACGLCHAMCWPGVDIGPQAI